MADKGKVEVLIRLKNQVSKELAKVNKDFKKTSTEVNKTKKTFKGLGTDAKKGLDGVSKSARKAKESVNGLSRSAKSSGQALSLFNASTLTLVGSIYALSRAVKAVVSTFAEFDDTMRAVGAVSNATSSQLQNLTAVARNAGATTRFTATQAAEGLRFLAMAGFEVQESIEALPGVLQLASAGALDLGQSADIASNILTGFGRKASELGEVNDVLVKTFTSTNTNLIELGEAFKLVAPIASAVGTDFNDLSASIGLLGNAGLKGTLAGTSLRGAIDALLNPTKQEAEFMQELSERIGGVGLQVRDAQGNFKGFLSIVKQLEQANIKGDEALKLFGLRAGPGIAALVNQGSEALEGLIVKLNNSGGTAERIAKQMEAGLGGALRELKSAMTELVLVIGDDFAPLLISIVKSLTGFIRAVGQLDTTTKVLLGTFATMVTTLGLWKLGLARVVVGVINLTASMHGAVASSLALGTAMKATLAGAVIYATFEIGKLVKAFYELRKEQKKQQRILDEIKEFYGDLTGALDFQIESVEELRKKTSEQLEEYKDGLKDALKAYTQLLLEQKKSGQATTETRKKIQQLREAMHDFIDVTEGTSKVSKQIKDIGTSAKESAKAYREAFNTILQSSQEYYDRQIFLTKEASAQGILSKEEEARKIIALETLKFDDMFRTASEYLEKSKNINKQNSDDVSKNIEIMKKAVKGLETARIQALQRYSDALKKLNEEERNAVSLSEEFQQALKDLTDKDLNAKEKLKSDQKEINKLQSEAYQLIKKGDEESLKSAEDKLRKAQELANSLEREVEYKGKIKQTEEEGRKDAIKETEQNIKLVDKLNDKRIEGAKENIKKEKELADTIKDQLADAQKQLDNFLEQDRLVSIDIEIDQQSLSTVQAEFKKIEETPLIKKIKYVTEGEPEKKASGGVVGYATGGKVRGAGGVDNVPAWLTAGEYVIKKDAVERIGLPFLNALNNMNLKDMMGTAKQKYATGGFVSPLGMKSYSTLMKLANGGGVNDIDAEKNRISREYDTQIKQAKVRGDEDIAFVLEEEKIKLKELAEELKKQLEEINKEFEEQLKLQTAELADLKEMKKKLAPFGNATSITTGTGTKLRPILPKSLEQLKTEIPQKEEEIKQLENKFASSEKAIKKENSLQVKQVKLETKKELTDIERRIEDTIKDLEEEKRKAMTDTSRNYVTSSGSYRQQFFADGGPVQGAGGVDNVSAMLSQGEYVMKRSVVQNLGKPFFDRLNNFRVPRFAEGGSVGTPLYASSGGKDFGTVTLNIGRASATVTGNTNELSGLIQELKEAGSRL